MTKAKTEKILQRISQEPDFRREVCLRSHYWFFHTYLTRYIKYPCAEMHKQMLYFSGMEFIKKLVVLGFPQCGKSVIHSYSLPIWSILKGKQRAVVILVADSKERTMFRDRFEQELMFNQMLKQDFQLKYRRKGNHIFFSNPEGRIYIGDLEQDMEVDASLGQTPDLIIVDPLRTLNEKKYDKYYQKLQNLLDHAGNERTRKIIVGRGGGKEAPFNRLAQEMIESKEKHTIPAMYQFARDDEDDVAWKSKFPTPQSIAHELEKPRTKEEFFYDYFLLETIPVLPLIINESNENNAYPLNRKEWSNLKEEDRACIEELFFIPYQGKQEGASVLWGIKIKNGEDEQYIFQGEEWRGDPDSLDMKALLPPIREWLDKINPEAYIVCYGDQEDRFSAINSNRFGFTGGYGQGCNSRRDAKFNKELLQKLVNSREIFFRKELVTTLKEAFSAQDPEIMNHWIQHLAIAHPLSSRSPIIITSTIRKKP